WPWHYPRVTRPRVTQATPATPAATAQAVYTPQGTHQGTTGNANAYQLANRVGPQGGAGGAGGFHNPVPAHTQASGVGGYQGGGAGAFQGGGGGQQSLAALGYRAQAAAPSGGFSGSGSAGYQPNGGPGYRTSGGIVFSGLSEKDVQSSLKDYDGSSHYGSFEPHTFGYTVNDEYFGNSHGHNEVSDGSTTKGEYRVLLPDGRTQIVTYSADAETGFMAKVAYEGEAQPYQPPADKLAAYQAKPSFNPGRSSFKQVPQAAQAAGAYAPPAAHYNS
ncbi:uncharacterized protein, partial [Panulirus ornatus]|uniref:uncharacterized protein n=1 Tax=Panulirus ornatus TaxID=150431 RepID=UPI003A836EE6